MSGSFFIWTIYLEPYVCRYRVIFRADVSQGFNPETSSRVQTLEEYAGHRAVAFQIGRES